MGHQNSYIFRFHSWNYPSKGALVKLENNSRGKIKTLKQRWLKKEENRYLG